MLNVATLTLPIYLAIAVGYVMTRYGPVPQEGIRAIGAFVLNVALPALLFSSIARADVGEILHPTYLLAYALGGLCCLLLGFGYGRVVEKERAPADAFYGMGVSCPNSGFIGYPVVMLLLPSIAGPVLGMNMIVENLLIIPAVLALAGRQTGGSVSRSDRVRAEIRNTLSSLVRNPLLIALVLGMIASLVRVPIPDPVFRTLDLFADASTPAALFAVGGMLVGLPLKGMGRRIAVVSTSKLVLHPLLVAGALALITTLGMPTLPPEFRAAVILSAGMPVFTLYPVIAQRFGVEHLASTVVIASTAASFLTLSVLTHLLGLG